MNDDFAPLSIMSYAEQALTTDQQSDAGSLTFPLLGLFGETGSLLSEVKKKHRDRASYIGYAGAVVDELGDVLWYLTAVASRGGLTLQEIISKSFGHEVTSFAALQPPVMPRTGSPSPTFEQTLLQLAGEVGLLIIDQEAGRLRDNQSALAGRLIPITRTLIKAATEAGVTLEAAAIKNLSKIFDRWPKERNYPEALDAQAVEQEQLPRTLSVEVFEREVGGKTYVFQRCNNINIGDRLTDNAMTPDDYRFHDVFHYAYVAVLGWSPVIRGLFRLKRKSDPRIDEAQDGARAMLIEEGVTTWIFGQAVNLNLFAGMAAGDLPFDLLKHVRQFVSGYEVESRPLWVWEEAILTGYDAFRFLREHRRGLVKIDMNRHTLTVEKLP